MNILVTGGCGFIGSHICDTLGHEHRVLALDNLSAGKRESVTCPIVVVDITNPPAVLRAVQDFKPDIIIHAAAQVMLRKSIEEPLFDATQNILGTISVLEAARQCPSLRKFIYLSTGGARYGQPEHLPVKENDPVRPLSPYGISKHTAEHYLEAYSTLYGFPYVIFCFGNVYGPRDDASRGRIIPIFAEALLAGKQPHIFGDGGQTRDFLYVEDIAKLVASQINPARTSEFRLFNLASGKNVSINTIFGFVARELDSQVKPIYDAAIKGEIRDMQLDISLVAQELGFVPTTIEEGIKKTMAWYKKTWHTP